MKYQLILSLGILSCIAIADKPRSPKPPTKDELAKTQNTGTNGAPIQALINAAPIKRKPGTSVKGNLVDAPVLPKDANFHTFDRKINSAEASAPLHADLFENNSRSALLSGRCFSNPKLAAVKGKIENGSVYLLLRKNKMGDQELVVKVMQAHSNSGGTALLLPGFFGIPLPLTPLYWEKGFDTSRRPYLWKLPHISWVPRQNAMVKSIKLLYSMGC